MLDGSVEGKYVDGNLYLKITCPEGLASLDVSGSNYGPAGHSYLHQYGLRFLDVCS